MAEESLIEEMRAALRGDRERAESRQQGVTQPDAVVGLAEEEPLRTDLSASALGASARFEQAFEPAPVSPVPESSSAPGGLLVRLTRLRSRR